MGAYDAWWAEREAQLAEEAGAERAPATDGERLVAAYIRQRRLRYLFEPEVGGRNPDFVVETPTGPVVLEVFEPHLKLPSRAGSFDSIKPVLGAFETRKRRQMQAGAGEGFPAVVVIGSTNSDIPYDTFALSGAMFGRQGVSFPLGQPDEAVSTFLGPGATGPTKNTSYDALAGIKRFNPTKWRVDRASATRAAIADGDSNREVWEAIWRREEIAQELLESGLYDPDAAVARLVILHNPFAKVPLPYEFAWLHDDQYGVVDLGDGRGEWCRIAEGRRRWEVPT